MRNGPLALLFSSDEEAGTSRCIRAFLATGRRFRGVVVSEVPPGVRVLPSSFAAAFAAFALEVPVGAGHGPSA